MHDVRRIIDANANRAREAMRVMEEAARFLLDDAPLTDRLKQMRHRFAQAVVMWPELAMDRDTPGDVGVPLAGAGEYRREQPADVVIAAGKRLSEALRSIEEYAKTLGPEAAALPQAVEQLRYEGYDLEKQLTAMLGVGRSRRQWRVCVLISEGLCPGCDWQRVASAAVAGGADCLQLREKSLDAGELLQRARRLVELARPTGVDVIINDRPDVAQLAGAAGVHLGQGDLPCAEVRRLVGPKLLIGVSTSCLDEAKQALRDGADYCGVGPMFETTTKQKDVIVGPAYLAEFVKWGKLPHLAIGGVHLENIEQLSAAGGAGVAVSSSVCRADDPAAVVRALRERLCG